MTARLTVSWTSAAGRTTYFIDGSPVGEDAAGVENILASVRSRRDTQIVLRAGGGTLGGGSLIDSVPFADKYGQLETAAAAGRNRIAFELK